MSSILFCLLLSYYKGKLLGKVNACAVERVGPGLAQAGVGDGHGLGHDFVRTGHGGCGQRTERDGITVHGGLLDAHQRQGHGARVVGLITQGQAGIGQVYAAAVTAQPRHTAVGGGKVHRKAVQRVGHSDVCGGKRGAGLLVVFGTVRVELGQVVPAGLHRPDLIPLGAERLFAVGLHADVDQQRSAVPVERHAAHIVVVVAVGVAAGLAAQCIGTAAADENADAGIPDIVRSGGGGGFGKVGDLALGHCGLDVVEQVDALAVVGVVQTVRVGVRGQYGGPVAGASVISGRLPTRLPNRYSRTPRAPASGLQSAKFR